MKVSRDKVREGVIDYLQDALIPNIPDKGLKFILNSVIYAFKQNTTLFDKYVFDNPMLSIFIKETDGMYDLDMIFNALTDSMSKFGYFQLTVPKIPIVTQDEKILRLSPSDLETLKKHIIGG